MRGRFAPSPSGEMHLGNAWTALLAWLQVRQANGVFVLRIEDIDPERSKPEYIEQILADLHWLGLDWDEGPDVGGFYGPYLQSKRLALYETALADLQTQGLVYPCFCSRADIRAAASAPHGVEPAMEYPGTCRTLSAAERQAKLIQTGGRFSLRFCFDAETVNFHDLVFGHQAHHPAAELGDFVVRRSDGVPAYQLAVVVDDAAMQITHVLRGADLLASTSRQIALFESLGLAVPQYAHAPLLYGPDGRRLSKRHGDISLKALRERGVEPGTIVGWLGYWAGLLPQPCQVQPADLISRFGLHSLPKQGIEIDPQGLSSRL